MTTFKFWSQVVPRVPPAIHHITVYCVMCLTNTKEDKWNLLMDKCSECFKYGGVECQPVITITQLNWASPKQKIEFMNFKYV